MNISQLKGYIFELEVLYLVLRSGYRVLNASDVLNNYEEQNKNIKGIHTRRVEFQGRGTWHQIDIPCDSLINPSFIYPIRLFGEVKYRNKKIDKTYIREYIGIKDDITQNYCVARNDSIKYEERQKRRTEVFVYFSASGFDSEAEKLAYAHGIKTISYENNEELREIKQKTDDLAHYLRRYKEEKIKGVLDHFYKIIDENFNCNDEYTLYLLERNNDICSCFNSIKNELASIKTSFIATANSGFTIHVLSKNEFPDYLFYESDFALITIHNEEDVWYISFSEDETMNTEKNKFYFSMPQEIIEEKEVVRGIVLYPEKQTYC